MAENYFEEFQNKYSNICRQRGSFLIGMLICKERACCLCFCSFLPPFFFFSVTLKNEVSWAFLKSVLFLISLQLSWSIWQWLHILKTFSFSCGVFANPVQPKSFHWVYLDVEWFSFVPLYYCTREHFLACVEWSFLGLYEVIFWIS